MATSRFKIKMKYYEIYRSQSILGINRYISLDKRIENSLKVEQERFLENRLKLKELEDKRKKKVIEKLKKIGNYRGKRHRANLPCNGQRTHTNSKTRRKFLVK